MLCVMPKPLTDGDKSAIASILNEAKTVAVIGLSPDTQKDSHRVAAYLQNVGYKIVPVYPKEETILGEKVYRSLDEIPFAVDVVNVFRKGDALPDIVRQAAQKDGVKLIWGQIGCYDEQALVLAHEAGLPIVAGHCLMVEHHRLLGD